MKTKSKIQTKSNRMTRAGAMVAGSFMACCVPLAVGQDANPAGTQEKPEPEAEADTEAPALELAPGDYSNWIDVAVGGTIVNKDDSRFQQRYHMPADQPFGGINDLHWEKSVGDNGFFKIDGRALLEQNDYSVKLDYTQEEKFYLRAGYKEFRVWYDGVGGYNSLGDTWSPLRNDDLSLDRGEGWVEGGLTLPNWPVIKLRYAHLFRDGKKDSTIWGPASVPGGQRGITGSFYDIDEQRDIVSLDAKHTLGKTELGLGASAEFGSIDDSLNLHQATGGDTYVTQDNGQDNDTFNVHAFSTTRFNEKYLFSAGYSFTTLDTDLSGSRIYGSDYDSVYDPGFAVGPGYIGLAGGSQMDQHVLNLNFQARPWKNVSIVPSVRLEKQDLEGRSVFQETPFLDMKTAENERDFKDISERLEARYNGLKNWVLFARGDWVQGDGSLEERQQALAGNVVELDRDSDFTRFTQKYTAGANWYPLQRMNFSSQYYYKLHNNEYDHRRDSTPNDSSSIFRYPAYLVDQDFETHDVNFRVTWRPLSVLTLVSRYDFQLSTIESQADLLSSIESAESTRHIFSESATWQPSTRFYLQGNLNYVLDETTTPIGEVSNTGSLVQAAQNDYWTASLHTGFVLNDRTDLQATYFYTRADNYVDNSSVSQPYGAGFEEHGVTATLTRTISKSVRLMLRYGYFSYRDQATDGFTDFTSHLVYSSLVYRF